jgi:capping protein (actin filament) muscle Z-line, beta
MAYSRRLPPTRIEENLDALLNICPEYADDLLGSVDQPLKLLTDKASGREYLACDYNRDGDSYRYIFHLLKQTFGVKADELYAE